jgi:hypothetical protein
LPYVLIDHVETAVESYYQHIELEPDTAANLRESLLRYLKARRASKALCRGRSAS